VKTVVVYASDPVKQVIGEFEIGEILYEEPEVLWAKTKNQSGITRNRFLEYFDNKPKGYAIEVKVAQTYDIPIPLKNLMVPRPPQSFRYLW